MRIEIDTATMTPAEASALISLLHTLTSTDDEAIVDAVMTAHPAPTATATVAPAPSPAPGATFAPVAQAPAPAPQPAQAPPLTPDGRPVLDSRGFPWDARIHSSNQQFTANGQWRQRRNLNAAVLQQVESELRGTPTPTLVAPAAQAVPVPAPAPTPVAPAAPALVAPAPQPAQAPPMTPHVGNGAAAGAAPSVGNGAAAGAAPTANSQATFMSTLMPLLMKWKSTHPTTDVFAAISASGVMQATNAVDLMSAPAASQEAVAAFLQAQLQ